MHISLMWGTLEMDYGEGDMKVSMHSDIPLKSEVVGLLRQPLL